MYEAEKQEVYEAEKQEEIQGNTITKATFIFFILKKTLILQFTFLVSLFLSKYIIIITVYQFYDISESFLY